MPQIEPTQLSTEEVKQQTESQESLHTNVLDKIKSGDVFRSLDQDLEPQQKKEDVNQKAEQQTQEQEEEQVQDNQEQEDTQDVDEEVIPKSKVQARFDQMRAQITRLEQKIAEKETAPPPVDDIQRQLDAMSEDSLEDSLTQVRLAKEKSRDDDTKLLELVKLERRIEKTIATAPQKFVQNQVTEFNKTAERLAAMGDIDNSNSQDVLKIAKGIYDKYPKMRSQVDGQAMALELAVEHYKQVSKSSAVKVDTQNLKGQINNLKKKTALDTKNVKGGGQNVNLDKLRSNAMTGSMKDKERFAQNDSRFKIDAMIPDFLKG